MEFHLPAAVTFYLGPIPVYSTIIAAWIAMAVLIVVSILATRNMQLVPGKLQNLVEFAVEGILAPCE